MYELARARLATAQQAIGDTAAAAATLAELRAFMASQPPANATTPIEPGRQQARAQALVEADFREANLLYQAAIGGELAKTRKDATKYPAAIAALRAFVANHQQDGGQLLLLALDNVGRLHAELGEMDKAEAAYSQLRQSDTDGADAAKLASVIFDAWLQQTRNLEAEMSQAVREDRDLRARAAIAGELKVTRDRLVHLGIDYSRGSPQPQLGILIATMQTAAALADWSSVAAAGERALAVFGDTADAGQRQLVDDVVRLQQATALMQLGRFQPAYDLLRAGAAGGQSAEYTRLLARALGGWLDYDDQGQPLKIAGLGRPDQAFDLYFGANGPRAATERFSLAWYRFHWDAYWYALQAAGKDSRYAGHAATIYRICKSTDDFATLQQQGSDGVDLARRFRLNPPPAVSK
jgi:hypothetical protein